MQSKKKSDLVERFGGFQIQQQVSEQIDTTTSQASHFPNEIRNIDADMSSSFNFASP